MTALQHWRGVAGLFSGSRNTTMQPRYAVAAKQPSPIAPPQWTVSSPPGFGRLGGTFHCRMSARKTTEHIERAGQLAWLIVVAAMLAVLVKWAMQ